MSDFEKWRRFRLMAKMFAVLFEADMEFPHPYDYASGECECDYCGLRYYDHPLLKCGVVLVCDGTLKKL